MIAFSVITYSTSTPPTMSTPHFLSSPLLLQVYREQAAGARSSLFLPSPWPIRPVDLWRVPLSPLPELQQLRRPPPAPRMLCPLRGPPGECGVLGVAGNRRPRCGLRRVKECSRR